MYIIVLQILNPLSVLVRMRYNYLATSHRTETWIWSDFYPGPTVGLLDYCITGRANVIFCAVGLR